MVLQPNLQNHPNQSLSNRISSHRQTIGLEKVLENGENLLERRNSNDGESN